MTKQELKLLIKVLDEKNPNLPLRFAKFDLAKKEVHATDMRVAVRIKLREDEVQNSSVPPLYADKRVLEAIVKVMGKDDTMQINYTHAVIGGVKISLQNAVGSEGEGFSYPDTAQIHGEGKVDVETAQEAIAWLEYDTAVNDTFINPSTLKIVQAHGEADKYIVKMEKQDLEKAKIGKVRVIGYNHTEGEAGAKERFSFVTMGVEYKKPTPTLF